MQFGKLYAQLPHAFAVSVFNVIIPYDTGDERRGSKIKRVLGPTAPTVRELSASATWSPESR